MKLTIQGQKISSAEGEIKDDEKDISYSAHLCRMIGGLRNYVNENLKIKNHKFWEVLKCQKKFLLVS